MPQPAQAPVLFNLERSRFQNPSWMLRDVGRHIYTIAPWEVPVSQVPVASDAEVEVLCTYSWSTRGSKNSNPILYVPGFPRKWMPQELPVQLPVDGRSLIDAHAHWVSHHQFEPTFQATKAMNPDARFDDVDIIINRNSLKELLSFVTGNRTNPFHLDLHLVGKTLIIGRKEKNATAGQGGFGHSFEDNFTTTQEKTSDTYHRVIRYQFGPLNLVVRHEVDACCDSDVHSLQEVFHGVDIPDDPQAIIRLPILHDKATAVIPRGTRIPQNQLLELKTSSGGGAIRQCWFGRTPNLCVAKHKQGLVTSAEMKNVWQQCIEWENAQQQNLRRLVGLFGQIKEEMSRTKNGRGVLIRLEKEAPLQIYEGNDGMKEALPEQVRSAFWG